MTPGSGVRDHVMAALLEAAASVLAERGPGAGMGEVAAAAGVSRATLYRYFPTREDLMASLASSAIEEAERGLGEADLDAVGMREALARMTRTLVGAATRYAILASDVVALDMSEVRARLGPPILSVLRRGRDDGTLRQDLRAEELFGFYLGVLKAAMRAVLEGTSGLERASSAAVSMFLDGAAARKGT